MNQVKLSILVISYNQEEFILRALEGAAIQQTDFSVEWVIADDFSSDKTPELIRDFCLQNSITYTFLETSRNLGMGWNYQRGFEACSGEYIAILEGDDYWTHPYRLQKHVDFLEAHPSCPLSFNKYLLQFQQSDALISSPREFEESVVFHSTKRLIRYNFIGNLSCCVIRRQLLTRISVNWFAYQPTDRFFGIYLSQFGNLAFLNEELSVYRITKQGIWSKQSSFSKKNSLIQETYQIDEALNYRYTKELASFRLGTRLKLWREEKLGNLPFPFNTFLTKLLPTGLLLRVAEVWVVRLGFHS
jgi:glycosyltransferase involved in cell wall biosynthesis